MFMAKAKFNLTNLLCDIFQLTSLVAKLNARDKIEIYVTSIEHAQRDINELYHKLESQCPGVAAIEAIPAFNFSALPGLDSGGTTFLKKIKAQSLIFINDSGDTLNVKVDFLSYDKIIVKLEESSWLASMVW